MSEPKQVLTPYLAVADARAAIDWYVGALDAVSIDAPIVMPDGRVGHAELGVFGARLFLSDEHPELGVEAPRAGAGSSVTIHALVDDVDTHYKRATGAGAVGERPPADTPHGRIAVIRDPFGHRWMLNDGQ